MAHAAHGRREPRLAAHRPKMTRGGDSCIGQDVYSYHKYSSDVTVTVSRDRVPPAPAWEGSCRERAPAGSSQVGGVGMDVEGSEERGRPVEKRSPGERAS
eukprot:scaffold18759_cov107-Isochrysis_galbana.AAC.3